MSKYAAPIGVVSASQPVTTTATPSSSAISRTSACSGDSSASTLPPGNSHRPASADGWVRRAASTLPSRTIAAPTTCCTTFTVVGR